MSGSNTRWADLSSQNERVVQLSESAAGCHNGPARSRWAALASQGERLVDITDPEFQLAGSNHASPGHVGPGMRLVAGAA
jgi:hypothetical protein